MCLLINWGFDKLQIIVHMIVLFRSFPSLPLTLTSAFGRGMDFEYICDPPVDIDALLARETCLYTQFIYVEFYIFDPSLIFRNSLFTFFL